MNYKAKIQRNIVYSLAGIGGLFGGIIFIGTCMALTNPTKTTPEPSPTVEVAAKEEVKTVRSAEEQRSYDWYKNKGLRLMNGWYPRAQIDIEDRPWRRKMAGYQITAFTDPNYNKGESEANKMPPLSPESLKELHSELFENLLCRDRGECKPYVAAADTKTYKFNEEQSYAYALAVGKSIFEDYHLAYVLKGESEQEEVAGEFKALAENTQDALPPRGYQPLSVANQQQLTRELTQHMACRVAGSCPAAPVLPESELF